MDFWSVCSFLRGRRFESFFETSFRQSDTPEPQQKAAAAVAVQKRKAEDWYEDDDRFWTVILSVFRIVVCFLVMMVTTALWAVVMVVLLPWPYERVRQGNLYGHVTGRMLVKFQSFCLFDLLSCLKFYDSCLLFVCNFFTLFDE